MMRMCGKCLMYVCENGERFEFRRAAGLPGCMKLRAKDLRVRSALLTAARKDGIPQCD